VNYYQSGQLGVALEELNTAVASDRTYAPAYGALALVYMELKDDERAEANFRQALKMNPNSSETKNNYGLFLCQHGREKEGVRQLLDALKNPLYPTPDVAYKNAGVCARKAGDIKDAENYFQRALLLNPRQAQALYGLAEANYARDDYVVAKQYLVRYVSLMENPGPEALWLGARIEHRLGDRTALANYGLQLRRRYPSSPETKAYLDGRFE
jgi:type IV pilus assembly protein PilF